jgi:hypothetical protein
MDAAVVRPAHRVKTRKTAGTAMEIPAPILPPSSPVVIDDAVPEKSQDIVV